MELLGRIVRGDRHSKHGATERLRAGLGYALKLNAQDAAPVSVLTVDQYVDLRNFVGHGAASANTPLTFEPWTGSVILHLVCRALDGIWVDAAAMTTFAECEIWPMYVEEGGHRVVIHVGGIQAHLLTGHMPSEGLAHSGWRGQLSAGPAS